jgi:hypothetical protein
MVQTLSILAAPNQVANTGDQVIAERFPANQHKNDIRQKNRIVSMHSKRGLSKSYYNNRTKKCQKAHQKTEIGIHNIFNSLIFRLPDMVLGLAKTTGYGQLTFHGSYARPLRRAHTRAVGPRSLR